MRYLDIEELNALNTMFNQFEPEDGTRFLARAEAYSCKAAGSDKKLWKQLALKYEHKLTRSSHTSISGGEPEALTEAPSSPTSYLDPKLALLEVSGINLKTFSFIVSTMNQLFPDYDFTEVDPVHFHRIDSIDRVMSEVNTIFLSTGLSKSLFVLNDLSSHLWGSLDDSIEINDCEIYTYDPEDNERVDDPFKNASIWSFNYFFWNKRLKRILVFYCKTISLLRQAELEDSLSHRSITPAISI